MVNPRSKNSLSIYTDDSYFSSEAYYYDYLGNKPAYQKGFRSKLDLLCKYQPRRGRLLDVGAAYGFFMEEATKRGFQAYGVELAPRAAGHASKYGEVFTQSLTELATDYRFSAITFIDSLEHFEQPLDGLRSAWHLLEDGGVVAVMVPNIDSWFARLLGTKWHLLLPEEHLFYFSPRSVPLMLDKAGFEMLHIGSGSYGRSAAEILRVLLRGKVGIPSAIDRILKKVAFEINLGDIFAIARKVTS